MSEHDRDSVKDGEDAGEKKVTFNDTTEEKNYTKDREVDEEEKHVGKHVTTSEPIVINTTEKNFESEREAQIKATDKDNEKEEKSQFEPRNDNTDEPNQHKTIKDDDSEDEITPEKEIIQPAHKKDTQLKSEGKTNMQDQTENTPSTRFSKDSDQALSKEMDKTTENYFTDSFTDDDKMNTVKPAKVSATDDVNEEKAKELHEPAEREFGSSKDQYKSNLVREQEDQTEVTIITKKRGEPPRELDVMTDDDKLRTNKTEDDIDADEIQRKSKDEDSYSKDSFIESDADTKSLSKSDHRKSGSESETNEKEKQDRHRCPSPDDSSTYSEPHIVTKKTGEIRSDEPKEQEATKTKRIDNETKDTKQSAPNRFESKGVPVKATSQKQVIVSNKQPVPRKAVNQRAPSAVRSQSPRQIVAQQKQQQPRMAKSAGPAGRQAYSRNVSSVASSRSPSRWSRPRTSGYRQEERRRKEKEFFTAELQRLKKSLKEESKKIKKPKERDHYPNVFNSLEPYYNTYTPQYLIQMPDTGYPVKQPPEAEITMKEMKLHRDKSGEEKDLMYTSRCTAIGLCDPWDSLHMDKSVLPKIETSEMRRKRMEKMHEPPKTPRSSNKKRPEAKLGSTRLPKFPVINLSNQDLATKELVYTDIPMLRDELVRSFSHNEGGRKKDDYTRTRQDFFRMELDRITEMHKNSQPHMKAAYFAYLQNTPGSRKAVYDCLRELNKKEEKQSPQAVA